jgi:hypothetical protein
MKAALDFFRLRSERAEGGGAGAAGPSATKAMRHTKPTVPHCTTPQILLTPVSCQLSES